MSGDQDYRLDGSSAGSSEAINTMFDGIMAEAEIRRRLKEWEKQRPEIEDLRGALWKVLYWASEAPLTGTKKLLGTIAAEALGEPFPV